MAVEAAPARDAPVSGAATIATASGARRWAVFLLLLIYVFNFIDRSIIGTLGQAIKEDLKITDLQLGLLGGLVFALFYSFLGLPIARLAERKNRVSIIALAAAFWSLMTTLCGFAQSYTHLLICRLGVGVGEAGYVPAGQSLITDYFPPNKRSTAVSIFNLGIPLGMMFGAFAAGWINKEWGWRAAFLIVGAPGLALALLFKFSVKEPPRGRFEGGTSEQTPPFGALVKLLLSKKSFIHMTLGSGAASFAGYSLMQFTHPFLVRVFHLDYAFAAVIAGLITGGSTAISMGVGGVLPDIFGKKDRRFYAWIPAVGVLAACPLFCAGFVAPTWQVSTALLLAGGIFQFFFMSPTYASCHNMVEPRMRASTVAIVVLSMNIIGLMCGPTFTGFASDHFAGQVFSLGDYAALCPGGKGMAGAPAAVDTACKAAAASGLRTALMIASLGFLWSSVHYFLAARTLRKDVIY